VGDASEVAIFGEQPLDSVLSAHRRDLSVKGEIPSSVRVRDALSKKEPESVAKKQGASAGALEKGAKRCKDRFQRRRWVEHAWVGDYSEELCQRRGRDRRGRRRGPRLPCPWVASTVCYM
jgi:hypothetical protein